MSVKISKVRFPSFSTLLADHFVDTWGIINPTMTRNPKYQTEMRSIKLFGNNHEKQNNSHISHVELLKELGEVRKNVFEEYQSLKTSLPVSSEEIFVKPQNEILKKRLLYLFLKDLSSSVCGQVLDYKEKKDVIRANRVTLLEKVLGWLFVVLLNSVLLLYVYLFAMRQTQSRQSAWFISFVMWLVFEVLISSTGLVLIFHLLIPLYVMSDVQKVKERVIQDILSFRESVSRNKNLKFKKKTQEERNGPQNESQNESENTVSSHSCPSPSHLNQNPQFNAAKYLFISWRVAWLFRWRKTDSDSLYLDLKEEEGEEEEEEENRLKVKEINLILGFSTPWPKRSFKREKSTVSREYDEAVILTALSRVLMYFVMKLLEMPSLVQDSVVQMLWNGGTGSLIILFLRLSEVNKYLPIVTIGAIVVMVWLMSGTHSADWIPSKSKSKKRTIQVTQTPPHSVSEAEERKGGVDSDEIAFPSSSLPSRPLEQSFATLVPASDHPNTRLKNEEQRQRQQRQRQRARKDSDQSESSNEMEDNEIRFSLSDDDHDGDDDDKSSFDSDFHSDRVSSSCSSSSDSMELSHSLSVQVEEGA